MFPFHQAFSSYSVHDLEQARTFYQDTLQLNVKVEAYMLEIELPGAGHVLLYIKDNHEPATFTVLNFKVEDIEGTVTHLKDKGIVFESYDMPHLKTDEHHIFNAEDMNIRQAWFKDPSGNILSVIEG